MQNEFRGECSYQPEFDNHFPHLTVSQTLAIATAARTSETAAVKSGDLFRTHGAPNATIANLGLSQTLDVKVGNEFVLGISGGERKRTSIAEMLVGSSPVQCWDNSTKGLDSANALAFTRTLRQAAEAVGSVAIVTLYQASEDIYQNFDKVLLLYEGHQIFFGSVHTARSYFTNLGFVPTQRITTSDFLTSLTNPPERVIRDGYAYRVPSTAHEFAEAWQKSEERAGLLQAIETYWSDYPIGQKQLAEFRNVQRTHKSRWQRSHSPYTIHYLRQVLLCLVRSFQRLRNDLAPPVSSISGNAILSIILGSVFYDMPNATSSFFGRGVSLFFIILTNTFLGAFEGVQLWDHRAIVEKHFQFAFYHPSAEAIASMICDIPNKVLLTTFFNVPYYFMANMRRTPEAFFIFYLFAFASLLTGSMLFRTIGAMSKTLTASIAPGADFILMLVIYTGFVLPIPSMPPWFRWFSYLNPVGYAFESLMINEFSGRQFACATFVPQGSAYQQVNPAERRCAVVGADSGSSMVDGDKYLEETFQYYPDHLWRNLGLILLIMMGLCGIYLLATDFFHGQRSKGEVLIFRRGQMPDMIHKTDEETNLGDNQYPHSARIDEKGAAIASISGGLTSNRTEAATFLWNNLCYDVKTKNGSTRLLDDIEGWIKPGTLTALMGASGAGECHL